MNLLFCRRSPAHRYRSLLSISCTKNFAFSMASAAAAIALGERPPSQSVNARAAKMAAATTIAC